MVRLPNGNFLPAGTQVPGAEHQVSAVVYHRPGVHNGWPNPAALLPGTHPITYTYTDPDGCAGPATANLVVTELPAVSLVPPVDLCAD